MTKGPEKSGPPTQSMTCCSLDLPLWPDMSVEYVLQADLLIVLLEILVLKSEAVTKQAIFLCTG